MPLLAHSRLENRTISKVLSLLSELNSCLQELDAAGTPMKPSLVSYVFFPLSTLLSRNEPSSIPDQVLERVFIALELLFRWWWWTCEDGVWEQIFMLAGAMLGGPDGKGKGRARDDETKAAAAKLILCLVRDRSDDPEVVAKGPDEVERARARLNDWTDQAQTKKFIPVVGQTLNSLLQTATSQHLPLQLCSLEVIETIVSVYMPEAVVSSILPGVVSTMVRIALGQTDATTASTTVRKGWVSGNVVAAALRVLDVVVIRAISDDACLRVGIVKEMNGLEDLVELVSEPAAVDSAASPPQHQDATDRPYETLRTRVWLRATASQILIAFNTLTPLMSHPTPSALLALAFLSASLLTKTRLTLPDVQPLLLSFLLTLSNSNFTSVSARSREALATLLSPPFKARHTLLQILLRTTSDNLASLPRLLPAHADAKVSHAAGQVEAVCRLGQSFRSGEIQLAAPNPAAHAICSGVGKLLGPAGHIEKWGWSLLQVLEFTPSAITVASAPVAGLLEGDAMSGERIVFSEVSLKHVSERSTQDALENMLRALGGTGGEECLFSVEWFIGVGLHRPSAQSSAALWCACRILEGVAGISLSSDDRASEARSQSSRRLEKFARWLTKAISELWNKEETEEENSNTTTNVAKGDEDEDEMRPAIEYTKGLTPLQTRFDLRSNEIAKANTLHQPQLQKAFALQLLCVSAAVLQSRFNPLLMHALYPLLHSLVSPDAYVASVAWAALQHVTSSTAYASPGNLLLSNFDYALDSVSRRLTRRWLDVDATKVLVVLVRLVGRDVVARAGDVVEECFDRLDDFHGYETVVEGLVEALQEVVKVVEAEDGLRREDVRVSPFDDSQSIPDSRRVVALLSWLEHRNDPQASIDEDYGAAPREDWGKGKGKEVTEEEETQEKKLVDESSALADPPPTPSQALTKQIVTRSLYLLTHGSPSIRARILSLLRGTVSVLPSSALLPAVHKAWPFVLNRLADPETYVVAATASFVEALVTHFGDFMTARVWDDIWPRFRTMLGKLDTADATNALARRAVGAASAYTAGADSAYTHSHRLYRAMLRTMTAAMSGGVQPQDGKVWDVMLAFRRFLRKEANDELQACARQLYVALGKINEDAIWLVLTSTAGTPGVPLVAHLRREQWDIQDNVNTILVDLTNSNPS